MKYLHLYLVMIVSTTIIFGVPSVIDGLMTFFQGNNVLYVIAAIIVGVFATKGCLMLISERRQWQTNPLIHYSFMMNPRGSKEQVRWLLAHSIEIMACTGIWIWSVVNLIVMLNGETGLMTKNLSITSPTDMYLFVCFVINLFQITAAGLTVGSNLSHMFTVESFTKLGKKWFSKSLFKEPIYQDNHETTKLQNAVAKLFTRYELPFHEMQIKRIQGAHKVLSSVSGQYISANMVYARWNICLWIISSAAICTTVQIQPMQSISAVQLIVGAAWGICYWMREKAKKRTVQAIHEYNVNSNTEFKKLKFGSPSNNVNTAQVSTIVENKDEFVKQTLVHEKQMTERKH